MPSLVEADDVGGWWRPRPPTAHKWKRAVRVVAGSPGMTGAAAPRARRRAMRAGAGMVSLSSPGADARRRRPRSCGARLPAFDWAAAVLDDLDRFGSLVIGPGLGRDAYDGRRRAVPRVAAADVPVVVDGDGLLALAWDADGADAARVGVDGPDRAHAARRRVTGCSPAAARRRPARRRPPPGRRLRRASCC